MKFALLLALASINDFRQGDVKISLKFRKEREVISLKLLNNTKYIKNQFKLNKANKVLN